MLIRISHDVISQADCNLCERGSEARMDWIKCYTCDQLHYCLRLPLHTVYFVRCRSLELRLYRKFQSSKFITSIIITMTITSQNHRQRSFSLLLSRAHECFCKMHIFRCYLNIVRVSFQAIFVSLGQSLNIS